MPKRSPSPKLRGASMSMGTAQDGATEPLMDDNTEGDRLKRFLCVNSVCKPRADQICLEVELISSNGKRQRHADILSILDRFDPGHTEELHNKHCGYIEQILDQNCGSDMMAEYSNPPSVGSNVGGGNSSNHRKTAVLRLEKGKTGKVDVKAGQKIWDSLPLYLREDIEAYFNLAAEAGDSGRGERLFREVKEFFDNPAEPTVKEMRKMIPKGVLVNFHTDQVAEGREKIRDMWIEQHRPEDWHTGPQFPRFADPNNGSKLQKSDLLEVYRFLKIYFHEHESKIYDRLGLDAQHQVESPWHLKVVAQLCRTQRDVEHVMGKVKLSAPLKKHVEGLKALLDGVNVKSDNEVLPVFDITSAIQRLLLEIEMATKPDVEFVQACAVIHDKFMTGQPFSTVQPSSEDVGQQYLHSMDSSPLHLSTDPMLNDFQLPLPLPALALEDYDIKSEVKSEVIPEDVTPSIFQVKDVKDVRVDSSFPASNVQSITSDSIDTLSRTPDHTLAQTSEIDTATADILATLCRDLDIEVEHSAPAKKLKIDNDFTSLSDPGNTMMDGITLQEVGIADTGLSEVGSFNFGFDLLQQVFNSPVIQQVVDEQIHSSKQTEPVISNLKTASTWLPGTKPYYSRSMGPATQMTVANLNATMGTAPMIPLTVMGLDDAMEVE